jgi:pyruvate dehydrogenase E2 component (dihydrolipoamide acetyltransferase)
MAKIVGLPKLSPTMEEGTLAKWAKKEGDDIAIDDLVAEVETDKATMEWRAFDKGVLLKILAPEGTTLKPDQPVAIIGQRGEDIAALLAQAGSPASAAPPAAPAAPPAPSATAAAPAQAAPAGALQEVAESRPNGGRVLASPLVRRLAREHDVDLRGVRGSGPGGRIVKRDLDEALVSGAAQPVDARAVPSPGAASPSAPSARGVRSPPVAQKLSQMRKTIARRLTESKQTVPHFYLTIDVDAGPIWDARAGINAELERSVSPGLRPGPAGEKVSVNDLLIKACAVALRRVPTVNASFAGDQLLFHQVVDISVAVAIPDGLVTPVVRDADRKGVVEISREVKDLAKRAKEKKLKPEEMTGGTFSISNLGMYGVEDFAAVINPPEGAILAVGAVREEPVVRDGAIAPGRRMRMTLSCDHRVVDGATGAEWLAALRRLLEHPITMLV